MIRIIILLTVFILLNNITTAHPNFTVSPRKKITIKTFLWKTRSMEKFAKQLEEECNFGLLNAIHKDLKNLWADVMKAHFAGFSTPSLNVTITFTGKSPEISEFDTRHEMDDVRAFFKKLIAGYNRCSEKKLHINSEGEWEIYMKIFGKEYPKGEKEMRKEIFKKKKRDVALHNGLYRDGLLTYRINLNQFSDWTKEELKKINGFRSRIPTPHGYPARKARQVDESGWKMFFYNPNASTPASFDWQVRGYVNPVKNQGSCSSCYAIVGNEALEAFHKKKVGELVRLSAQNILDCTWYLGNSGCDKGSPDTVFEYAKNVGVVSNYWYPYTMNASHDCKWKYKHVAATDEGYYTVDYYNEFALRQAVAKHGPVAAGIGVNGFHEYESGVFYTKECGPLEHVVLVVGYGTDPEQGDYWLAKNCWGFWWGEDGYIRIARNKFNVCDIASYAHFPF